MISEKTVELNLTTELVNWIFSISKVRPYILAPSQREEGVWGYDVGLGGVSGRGVLLQFKRAYFTAPDEYEFKLNRTKYKDQHLRLQTLEGMGIPVYYVFPIFHTPNEVITYRRRLLQKTIFVKPSRIKPKGGPVGHHEVVYKKTLDTWNVHSEEGVPIDYVEGIEEVYDEVQENSNSGAVSQIVKSCNSVYKNNKDSNSDEEDDYELFGSQSILVLN